MKVALTDAESFIGKHIQWFFLTKPEPIETVLITKELVKYEENILEILRDCDVIIHCAKAHKGNTSEDEIYDINLNLTNKLIQLCERLENKPRIIFLSSIQALKYDTSYQKSMHDAGILINEYSKKNNISTSNLLIPHEFGEGCKPYDISVVSTFCYELVKDVKSIVNGNAVIHAVHAQDVARKVFDLLFVPVNGDIEISGTDISVSDMYAILLKFKNMYKENGIIPSFETPLHLQLFNTFRAHLFTDVEYFPKTIQLHEDPRGSLFEVVKEYSGGQTFVSKTKCGVTRGNHFHTRKIERFCVLQGEAEIKFRQPVTNNSVSFKVSGLIPQYIDIPTFYAHSINNIGEKELVTSFWSNEIFNPEDTDTYLYNV